MILNTGKNTSMSNWDYRRNVLNAVLIFCSSCVIYILIHGIDDELYRNIATDCFTLAGTVVCFYTGAKTTHDINNNKLANDRICSGHEDVIEAPPHG